MHLRQTFACTAPRQRGLGFAKQVAVEAKGKGA